MMDNDLLITFLIVPDKIDCPLWGGGVKGDLILFEAIKMTTFAADHFFGFYLGFA